MARLRHRESDFPRRFGDVERLESRRLLSVSPTMAAERDDAERAAGGCPLCGTVGCFEHVGDDGTVMMACYHDVGAEHLLLTAESEPETEFVVASLDDTFRLHSNPTATKVIYLDFDGHVTSGTKWRNGTTFTNEAYSLDADFGTFNDEERRTIQNIWARVAEDFIPFDVDVTTEEPPLADLIKSGANDTRWGIRVVVGGDWADAAGIAYVGSFNWNSDTPAFVFAGKWWKSQRNVVASTISHEAGHTLGLGHDGYNDSAYYAGRGSGETSWGPIMGSSGAKNLNQWSKGEYTGATNRQDDLSIITTKNGFGYRPDDHGNTIQTATAATAVGPTTFSGIVGSSSDIDVFRFTTGGSIQVSIDPIASGTNLDVLAELLDANGVVVATSNPVDAVAASFSMTAAPGTYYVAVRGTGKGDGADSGYTAYGSLGQYTVSLVNDSVTQPTLSITNASVVEGDSGTTSVEVRVTLSAPATQPVTVAYATVDATATTADGDYLPAFGSLSFAVGERLKTFTILVRGDTKAEDDERITVRIADSHGATIARSQAAVMILDDDAPPTVAVDGPLSGMTTTYGDASESATLTVTGTKLTGDVTVTAPPGFEVSGDGEAFAATAIFAPSAGSLSGTLFVRLAATSAPGTFAGDVTLSSPTTPTVTVVIPSSVVTPRPLTLTGLSVAPRSYDGTAVATLTGTAALSGVVAGETVTLTGTATAEFLDRNAGTGKPVIVTGLRLSGSHAARYTLAPPDLAADILKRILTVRADDVTRRPGESNPAFTATITGFVAGETGTVLSGAVALSSTATAASPVGSYPIMAGPGTLAAQNYDFDFLAGTLRVAEAIVLDVPAGQTATDQAVRDGDWQFVKRGAGTLIVDQSNRHAGGTVVEAGLLVVRNIAALGGGRLAVGAGASVRFDVGFGTVLLLGLEMGPGATLDLGHGKLAIGPGGVDGAVLRQWISAGRNGGAWNGASGITSTAAALAPAGSRAVGFIVAADGSAIISFAAPGDTDLDGQVNVFDMVAINASDRYQRPDAEAVWNQGDFNDDRISNIFDLVDVSVSGAYNAGSYFQSPALATRLEISPAAFGAGTGQIDAAVIWTATTEVTPATPASADAEQPAAMVIPPEGDRDSTPETNGHEDLSASRFSQRARVMAFAQIARGIRWEGLDTEATPGHSLQKGGKRTLFGLTANER